MGLQGIVQQRAVGVAEAYADALSLEGARATALPQPFSPAHWMLVVSEDDTHHMAWVRFLPGRSLAERVPLPRRLRDMAAHYTPEPVWQRHVRGGGDARMPEPATAAWRHDGFRYFRSFAQIPALHEVASEGGRDCAWFRDLRFALPGLPPSFLFGMCRDPADGLWHRVRRRGAMWLD